MLDKSQPIGNNPFTDNQSDPAALTRSGSGHERATSVTPSVYQNYQQVPIPAEPTGCPCVWMQYEYCDRLQELRAEAGPSGISSRVIDHSMGAAMKAGDLRRESHRPPSRLLAETDDPDLDREYQEWYDGLYQGPVVVAR